MQEIKFGLEAGLGIDTVKLYAKPHINRYQMRTIRTSLTLDIKAGRKIDVMPFIQILKAL
jgi:hypothetical protein